MKAYKKGSKAERELMKILEDHGFIVVRIAGSGNNDKPDLLVSNGRKVIAVECKSTKLLYKYLDENELNNFFKFCQKFGAHGWYAIRFNRLGWRFLPVESVFGNRKITPDDGISLSKFLSIII